MTSFATELEAASAGGVRQAALLAHSLGHEDREWLLARLPEDRAIELRGLVAELSAMGLPAGDAVHAVGAGAWDSTAERTIGRIERTSAASMLLVLKDEPDALVALVLEMRNWPWREAFHAGLPPRRRARLSAIERGRLPARLAETVLSALAHRLDAAALAGDGKPATSMNAWWSRISVRPRRVRP